MCITLALDSHPHPHPSLNTSRFFAPASSKALIEIAKLLTICTGMIVLLKRKSLPPAQMT